ncbi:MAG: type II toxin-antitoxin system Phd/YefM family antitoxin [Candidatus Latescibacteria bacterium]|jgi:prevent-host-death family protein|nr:type II toxin-antitoxin system Phd/YefM family antitoxin [Candidatus Latescibacterota bacterium]
MVQVNIHEAKTHFSKLIKRVINGEEVVIARSGKPVARLGPIDHERKRPRMPGSAKGLVRIGADFDAPLPKELTQAFVGDPES